MTDEHSMTALSADGGTDLLRRYKRDGRLISFVALLTLVVVFPLISFVLPHQSNPWVGYGGMLAVMVLVVGLSVAMELHMQRLIRTLNLKEALSLYSGRGLSRRQQEDFIRSERWDGLHNLDDANLKLALDVLTGPIWRWIGAFPRTAKIRVRQVSLLFRTLQPELSAVRADSEQKQRAQMFLEEISQALPEWERYAI